MKLKIAITTIVLLLISNNVFAYSSAFQWSDVEFVTINFLQGSGPFVDAFNFCFTLISICGFIGAMIKMILKVITRS